jgi:hypothetical protein
MCAMMMTHVDKLGSAFHALKGCFDNGVGLAYECDYSAVCGLAGINVKKLYVGSALYCVGYTFYYVHVAPFAEVGHAFYDLFHGNTGLW